MPFLSTPNSNKINITITASILVLITILILFLLKLSIWNRSIQIRLIVLAVILFFMVLSMLILEIKIKNEIDRRIQQKLQENVKKIRIASFSYFGVVSMGVFVYYYFLQKNEAQSFTSIAKPRYNYKIFTGTHPEISDYLRKLITRRQPQKHGLTDDNVSKFYPKGVTKYGTYYGSISIPLPSLVRPMTKISSDNPRNIVEFDNEQVNITHVKANGEKEILLSIPKETLFSDINFIRMFSNKDGIVQAVSVTFDLNREVLYVLEP